MIRTLSILCAAAFLISCGTGATSTTTKATPESDDSATQIIDSNHSITQIGPNRYRATATDPGCYITQFQALQAATNGAERIAKEKCEGAFLSDVDVKMPKAGGCTPVVIAADFTCPTP